MGRTSRGARVAGDLAERLGRTLRGLVVLLGVVYRALPGIVAPCLVIYGVASIYRPAGLIVAGLLLFVADRRVTWASGPAGRE